MPSNKSRVAIRPAIEAEARVLSALAMRAKAHWGYSAETAVDGADALHHAVTRHPALIITDLHMPKMDGLELLRTVQASLPDVPAIVVTGTHEGSRTKTEAGRLAFGYLQKPVDVTRLKGLVEAAMEPGSRSGGSA